MTGDLARLRAANIARQEEWCPDQKPDMSFRAVELAGETGEALNVVKKLERERQGWAGSRATRDQLAEELADVVICADLLAITADIDLAAAVPRKFNATSEKVGLATRMESGRQALRTAYKHLEQQMAEAGFAVTSSEPLAYISMETLNRLVADESGPYQLTVPRDQPGPSQVALFTWPTPCPEADPPKQQTVAAEDGCADPARDESRGEVERNLYEGSAAMADGGDERMTAAEEVLSWLLVEKIGVPDDEPRSPNEAQDIIAAKLDELAKRAAGRNLYKGKYRALLKLVSRTRDKLVHVTDHIEDEGDRRYFGSTNDADDLLNLYHEMMSWIWDAVDETNRMKSDPYADIRALRARAEAAEAAIVAKEVEIERLREALSGLVMRAQNIGHRSFKSMFEFDEFVQRIDEANAALLLGEG